MRIAFFLKTSKKCFFYFSVKLSKKCQENKIFFKVPEDVYIVNLINLQDIIEYFNTLESEFIENYSNNLNNNYIEEILLTENQDIQDQFMKNKVIYTPGSCVIDTTLNFDSEFICCKKIMLNFKVLLSFIEAKHSF